MATLSMFSMLLNVCRIQKERHVESLTAEAEAVWCKYVACINVKLLKKTACISFRNCCCGGVHVNLTIFFLINCPFSVCISV